jgi:hypothetical protein
MDVFSLVQSRTSVFQDEKTPFTLFTAGLKRLMKQQPSPKFSTMVTNKKDDGQTDKKPNSLVCKNSKINF